MARLFDDLSYWDEYQEFIANDKMYGLIAELYIIIFEFLIDIFTKWSSKWERFKTSFNEDSIMDIFVKRSKRIKSLQAGLERRINSEHRRSVDRRLTAMGEQQAQILAALQSPRFTLDQLRMALGASGQTLLDPMGERYLCLIDSNDSETSPYSMGRVRSLSTLGEEEQAEGITVASFLSDQRGSLDMDHQLRPLKSRLAEYLAELAHLTTIITGLDIDAIVRQRVLSWVGKNENTILWIQGPASVHRPSQNTGLALLLVAPAETSDVKYVHHFCAIGSSLQRTPNRDIQLMDMLQSLITQLILCIPNERLPFIEVLQTHMTELQDETITFDDALRMLEPLRQAIPSSLFVIIDCFQDLEDRGQNEYTIRLLRLIGTLCSLGTSPGAFNSTGTKRHTSCASADGQVTSDDSKWNKDSECLTKICFTTDGGMDALAMVEDEGLLDKVEYSLEADDPGCDETETYIP